MNICKNWLIYLEHYPHPLSVLAGTKHAPLRGGACEALCFDI